MFQRRRMVFTVVGLVLAVSLLFGQTAIVGSRDYIRISAPSNPASGYLRVFANTSTGKLACLDSSGADCIPTGGGGASTIRQVWNAFMGACDNGGVTRAWGWGQEDANGATGGCDSGQGVMEFADAATGKRTIQSFTLPLNWSSGDAVDAYLWIRPGAYAQSKQTKFYVGTACRASGESATFSYNTEASALRTIHEQENNILGISVTSIPMTNCAAGELARIRMRRADSADAEDTYDGMTVKVVGFQLRYKVTVD